MHPLAYFYRLCTLLRTIHNTNVAHTTLTLMAYLDSLSELIVRNLFSGQFSLIGLSLSSLLLLMPAFAYPYSDPDKRKIHWLVWKVIYESSRIDGIGVFAIACCYWSMTTLMHSAHRRFPINWLSDKALRVAKACVGAVGVMSPSQWVLQRLWLWCSYQYLEFLSALDDKPQLIGFQHGGRIAAPNGPTYRTISRWEYFQPILINYQFVYCKNNKVEGFKPCPVIIPDS